MLGTTFYHSLTRKYCILFGNLFNDITVRRYDSSKNMVSSILVPITYASKRKWVETLDKNYQTEGPDGRPIAIQLPRMSFFFNSITPDFNRALTPLNQLSKRTQNNNELLTTYQPIPYKINAELAVFAKTHDDASQIFEQIIPYFYPDHTNSINLIPELGRTMDIVTRIINPQMTDIYDGQFIARQALMWEFAFEMDAWYFGPIKRQGPIKRVDVDLHATRGDGPVTPEDRAATPPAVRITATPGLTPEGKPTTNSAESIPYQDINAEDDYGFCIDIDDLFMRPGS